MRGSALYGSSMAKDKELRHITHLVMTQDDEQF